MAQNLRDRVRAGVGTFQEWLDDRDKDIAQGKANLETAARRFYGDTTQRAQQVVTRATSDVKSVVDRVRMPPSPQMKSPAKTPAATSRPTAPKDQRVSTSAGLPKVQQVMKRVADSEPVRKATGDAARAVGNLVGLGTGTLQTAEDVKDGAILFGRLLDVTNSFRHPRGEAAWDEVFGGAGRLIEDAKKVMADPRRAAEDQVRRARRDLDPAATPAAPTLPGEARRNFNIGRKQGEVFVEGVGWLVGAGELKTAARIGALSKADLVAKYRGQGFSEAKAAHLAEPYTRRAIIRSLRKERGFRNFSAEVDIPGGRSTTLSTPCDPASLEASSMSSIPAWTRTSAERASRRAWAREGGARRSWGSRSMARLSACTMARLDRRRPSSAVLSCWATGIPTNQQETMNGGEGQADRGLHRGLSSGQCRGGW